jgi:DNA repair protein RadC
MKSPDSQKKLIILNLNDSDRPREKYLAKGSNSLSDAELIAIILRSGSGKESVTDLSRRLLLAGENSLKNLSDMSLSDLMKVHGIGQVKAVTIRAAFDLGARIRVEKVTKQKKITCTTDLVELMQDKIANIPHEEFWAVFVSQSSAILGMENIGKGGLTSTTVDVRMIMKKALECSATGILLCHNHPSGNIKPSNQDINITCQIKEAADILNISILDHLIINKDNYFSFNAEGMI